MPCQLTWMCTDVLLLFVIRSLETLAERLLAAHESKCMGGVAKLGSVLAASSRFAAQQGLLTLTGRSHIFCGEIIPDVHGMRLVSEPGCDLASPRSQGLR